MRLHQAETETIALFDKIVDDARGLDANDYLYGYEASWDYDPEPNLGKIKARLLAVNFADDMANALELGLVERASRENSKRSLCYHTSERQVTWSFWFAVSGTLEALSRRTLRILAVNGPAAEHERVDQHVDRFPYPGRCGQTSCPPRQIMSQAT